MATFSFNEKQKNIKLEDQMDLSNIYRKRVFKKLPLRFPDYTSLVTQEAVTYLYPQSFTIDWRNLEIFVLYSPTGGSSTKRWVVVFGLNDAKYKGCFHAGDAGGEGIVVKQEGIDRFLYVKTTGTSLGKFLINTLPANKASLTPANTYDVGLFYDFSYRNNTWLVEQGGAPLGNTVRRSSFLYFDDNFVRTGGMKISTGDGGFWLGNYINYIPKRQGIALADGFILQPSGGYHGKSDVVRPYGFQGLKVLNVKGQLVTEGLVDPSKMISILEKHGFTCDRVEGEGVHVAPNGGVYSLMVHQSRLMDESLYGGIIIFKEFSSDDNSIDFSSAGKVYAGFNSVDLETGVYPRSGDGKLYDPITGALLDTVENIIEFMAGTDMKQFSFYSSGGTFKDIGNVTIPTGILVTITNASNTTFYMDYWGNPFNDRFVIYGATGARTQKRTGEQAGTTASRPTAYLYAGMQYFDTTINKCLFRNGANTAWVDAMGTVVT